MPDGAAGLLLRRGARAAPLRYRVIAVPGTGCQSLAPSADRMFAGLLHAEVWLLQKPHLSPHPGPQPTTAAAGSPDDCSPSFTAGDRLSAWQQRALALVEAAGRDADPALPQPQPQPLPLVLVGFSEGAELLPQMARALAGTVLLVMIGNAGLDPADTAALQARRLGHEATWRTLIDQASGPDAPDSGLLHGRDRRYWQDLLRWPLFEPLLADPRPLLLVRGGRDALVPSEAYVQFEAGASARRGGLCSVVFAQADHQLRQAGADRLQRVWAWIEAIARQRAGWIPDCAAIQASASGS